MKVILSVFTVGNMPNVGLRGRIVSKMKPFFLYLNLSLLLIRVGNSNAFVLKL